MLYRSRHNVTQQPHFSSSNEMLYFPNLYMRQPGYLATLPLILPLEASAVTPGVHRDAQLGSSGGEPGHRCRNGMNSVSHAVLNYAIPQISNVLTLCFPKPVQSYTHGDLTQEICFPQNVFDYRSYNQHGVICPSGTAPRSVFKGLPPLHTIFCLQSTLHSLPRPNCCIILTSLGSS